MNGFARAGRLERDKLFCGMVDVRVSARFAQFVASLEGRLYNMHSENH